MTTKTRKRSVRQSRAQEKTVPRASANSTSQVLSGTDLLNSSAVAPLEIPELPRNGRPGVVYIRQPSAKAMIRIFGRESAAELREQVQSSREVRDQQMARMIAGLVEDGQGNLLFTPEQADHLLDMHYAVFQRLAGAINNAFQSTGDDTEVNTDTSDGGEGENPFVQTDSSN